MSERVRAAVLAVAMIVIPGVRAAGQTTEGDQINRRAKTRAQPFYPDLAKKMNLTGTVRIEVTVTPNGMVREARVLGGHPVLASSALDAAKKWRFEPAPAESTGVIEFKFEPR